jgi:hypothetical protein
MCISYTGSAVLLFLIFDRVDIDKELEAADKEKPKEKLKSASQPIIENVIDSTGKS